jgi:excisionase family DNA binding protein
MQKENKITVSSNDVLSVQEAARQLEKHRATIYRWYRAGEILGVEFGGILFIPKSEVERIKKANHREETPGGPTGRH